MKRIPLEGQKFGRLTVVSYVGGSRYRCLCDCGNIVYPNGNNVRSGGTLSCGCLKREKLVQMSTKHKGKGTRMYSLWKGIKARCTNPNNKEYHNYGERGITICHEWEKDFDCFRNWALSHGYSDELTIDRIDNDKGYSPDNCRWVTVKEQSRNRRSTVFICINGEKKSLPEWCEIFGVNLGTATHRVKKQGLSGMEVFRYQPRGPAKIRSRRLEEI